MSAVLAFLLSDAGQTLLILAGGALVAYLRKRDRRADAVLSAAEIAFPLVEAWAMKSGAKGDSKAAKFFAIIAGVLASKKQTPLSNAEKRALYTRFLSERASAEKRMPTGLPVVN